jgi:peptide/nickel transport system permease protein
MQRYIVRRILQGVPILILVSVALFTLMRLLPGDPAQMMLGTEPGADAELLERVRRQLGLDKPIFVQYFYWLGNALQGNMGRSFFLANKPVSELIVQKAPATIELTVVALIIAIVVAVPAGIIAATKEGSWFDYGVSLFVSMGMAIPPFWLGITLILIFAARLKWLPASGHVPFMEDPLNNLKLLAMPAMTLSILLMAPIMRFLRSSLLEAMKEDYIYTARAKGLSASAVLFRHALKNALVPTITVIGLQFANLLSGAVIIEWVFGWPGLGWLTVQGMMQRDYPVVQGTVLVASFTFVFVNLLVDILYAVIDPRIRYD